MSTNAVLTGRPSVDRPWMKFYPEAVQQLRIPECTIQDYLRMNCPGVNTVAIHYYGTDTTWGTVFGQVKLTAKALRAIGFRCGDQIPVFLRSVPEFIFLLMAAEEIGASLLCRDNTLAENVEAVQKSCARVIIAHDFLSKVEKDAYIKAGVERIVLLSPYRLADRTQMPEHIVDYINSQYHEDIAAGPEVISWDDFIAMG